MRRIRSALALLGTTAALVAGTASPAAASHTCQPSDLVCLVTDSTTIPVGTPVVGPVGNNAFVLPVAQLCLPACDIVYVIVPGAMVSSSGTTLTTITLPEYGVQVDQFGFPTVYGGVPTLTPVGSPPSGITLKLQVPYVPVHYGNSTQCANSVPVVVGPVTAQLSGCVAHLTIAV